MLRLPCPHANLAAMPSMAHEILVYLFKNRPSLAAEILVEVLGLSLPPYTEARLDPVDRDPARRVPPVLRRAAVPVVTDPAEAARRPELGVLSAMAHGETEQGATIAAAVLHAIQGLNDERRLNSLNAATRRALEAMMKGYEYQSDFAKKYVAQGEAKGEARALLAALRVGAWTYLSVDRSEGEDAPTHLSVDRSEGEGADLPLGR